MSSKSLNTERLKVFRTTRYDRRFNDEAILQFLSSLDCPRSLTVWILYKSGEHQQLVDLGCLADSYQNAATFRDAYAATEFLSKSQFLELSVSKKDAAITKFRKYEELCKSTNSRFRNLSLDPNYCGTNASLLDAMIRKIDKVLGDFSADEFVDSAGWGPGVSTTLKGSEVSGYNKFHGERGITRDLYHLITPWFSTAYPSWISNATDSAMSLDSFFSIQGGNQVVTVPKNSKTDRVIAIEPGFNIWFQKAIGSMIRKRLRREGIDLNSQVRNQTLARLSSKDDDLVTVDFSSASDSIARELVRTVVNCSRWYTLMDVCRSKNGMLGSELIKWEKFSAMGNGFTFELESLIFYAAAHAVCKFLKLDSRKISVFGDDVILPKEAFSLYQSFCEFLGFVINTEKSCVSGYFRESCGAHFYNGVDCKPIYLKERVSNVESVYKLANSIRTYSHRRNNYYGCDVRFRNCWLHLLRRVPQLVRYGIPLGFGDGGIIMNFDEAVPSTSRRRDDVSRPVSAGRGFEGFRFPMIASLGVTRDADSPAMLLARLWVPSTEEFNNSYTLRGVVRARIVPDVLASQWYDLGPWI
jgi:hypothetical protein